MLPQETKDILLDYVEHVQDTHGPSGISALCRKGADGVIQTMLDYRCYGNTKGSRGLKLTAGFYYDLEHNQEEAVTYLRELLEDATSLARGPEGL